MKRAGTRNIFFTWPKAQLTFNYTRTLFNLQSSTDKTFLRVVFANCNYHDYLQARAIEGIGH